MSSSLGDASSAAAANKSQEMAAANQASGTTAKTTAQPVHQKETTETAKPQKPDSEGHNANDATAKKVFAFLLAMKNPELLSEGGRKELAGVSTAHTKSFEDIAKDSAFGQAHMARQAQRNGTDNQVQNSDGTMRDKTLLEKIQTASSPSPQQSLKNWQEVYAHVKEKITGKSDDKVSETTAHKEMGDVETTKAAPTELKKASLENEDTTKQATTEQNAAIHNNAGTPKGTRTDNAKLETQEEEAMGAANPAAHTDNPSVGKTEKTEDLSAGAAREIKSAISQDIHDTKNDMAELRVQGQATIKELNTTLEKASQIDHTNPKQWHETRLELKEKMGATVEHLQQLNNRVEGDPLLSSSHTLRWSVAAALNCAVEAYELLKFDKYSDTAQNIEFNKASYDMAIEAADLTRQLAELEAQKQMTLAVISACKIGAALAGGADETAGKVASGMCDVASHVTESVYAAQKGQLEQLKAITEALREVYAKAGDSAKQGAAATDKVMDALLRMEEHISRSLTNIYQRS